MNSRKSSNPTLRVHQPSPTRSSQRQPMLAQSSFNLGGGWNEGYPGAQHLQAYPKNLKHERYHKRASSGSSVASAGPPSPLDQQNIYPLIATDNYSPHYQENIDYLHTPQSAHTSKSLPTPTSDAFMYPNHYAAIDMRRIHSTGADESASYALSGAPSVSSIGHNSPATPHTNLDLEYEDQKLHGYQQYTPAYHQSMQDVFPDYTNNAIAYQQSQMRQIPQRHSVMASRIQAAQQDHLQPGSPITSNPREKSPFRQTSQFNQHMRTSVQPQQNIPQLVKTRTSVSPKELQLNAGDVEDGPSLFDNSQQPLFGNQRHGSNVSSFYAPNFATESSMQIPQQYPFVSQPSRQESTQSGTPDFPAHLNSMESTVEESEPSSQQSMQRPKSQPTQSIERPADTTSDAGTYSCTYHGCPLRFDTPAKLQKHKREGHRQNSPASPSATSLALRNSQAGPHECKRINPSTGKPCNSIFSRPYDLTRHEDTIHNGRKQKVRCSMCTEEKTFSRNDALTRHMRVVHPEVEWPGKQKRRALK